MRVCVEAPQVDAEAARERGQPRVALERKVDVRVALGVHQLGGKHGADNLARQPCLDRRVDVLRSLRKPATMQLRSDVETLKRSNVCDAEWWNAESCIASSAARLQPCIATCKRCQHARGWQPQEQPHTS